MKIKLFIVASMLMVGCTTSTTKEVSSQHRVEMIDIISRTKNLLAHRHDTVNKAVAKPQDSAMLSDLGAKLAINSAKLEVQDHELILWLPERIVFSFDNDEVKQRKTVQALADFMVARGDGVLRITGHTDAVGTDGYNKQLGMRRAAAVARQLIEAGVEAQDIIMVSQGADQPRVRTLEPELLNRRSDLSFPSID